MPLRCRDGSRDADSTNCQIEIVLVTKVQDVSGPRRKVENSDNPGISEMIDRRRDRTGDRALALNTRARHLVDLPIETYDED